MRERERPRSGGAVEAPRERILNAAYELFSARGVRDVGVEEVIAAADVARATLYRHFPSKTDLVLAFLNEREQRWTIATVKDESRRRGSTPEQQLFAIFDVFDEWFHRDDFEACSFVNVLLEMGPQHPLGRASIHHLNTIRTVVVESLAREAGLDDPVGFGWSWHILMKGSIIAAAEGDTVAAQRAKTMGYALLDAHRKKRGAPRTTMPAGRGR